MNDLRDTISQQSQQTLPMSSSGVSFRCVHGPAMRAFALVALLLAFPVYAQPSPHVTFGNSTITGLATTVGGVIGVDFFGGKLTRSNIRPNN